LQNLAAELNVTKNWIVTGDVEDNLGAIAALDILVHPTGQPEPFSGAVVEAMALGKPVVATNLGGTVEQVENNVTGYLVPADNPQALADAIQILLDDKARRLRMGERGRERYLERFSWELIFGNLQKEYAMLLFTKHGGKKVSKMEKIP
jgi:glycosyltransferase involved in cell wall biosynthesis